MAVCRHHVNETPDPTVSFALQLTPDMRVPLKLCVHGPVEPPTSLQKKSNMVTTRWASIAAVANHAQA